MAGSASLRRVQVWYDKQPLWLTENLLERLGLIVLGFVAMAAICCVGWLVVFDPTNTECKRLCLAVGNVGISAEPGGPSQVGQMRANRGGRVVRSAVRG
jgi:hypothetical protein